MLYKTKIATFVLMASAQAALAADSVTYSYDAKGRLSGTAVTAGPQTGAASAYTHDDTHNRLSASVTLALAPGVVANAGFETPALGAGFQYNPSVGGNSYVSLAGIAGNGSAWAFNPAPQGSQVAFIQGSGGSNGAITMNVSGLVVGGVYVVQFQASARPGYSANQLAVAFGSTSLGSHTPGSTNFAAITTPSFTASATTGVVSFTGVSGGNTASGIDAVAVVRVG